MRFSISDGPVCVVECGDEKVAFDVNEYRTIGSKLQMDDSLFDEINDYISTFTGEEQRKLFELYKDARFYLSSSTGSLTISAKMTEIVKEIYEYIEYDSLLSWFKRGRKIRYPVNCLERLDNTELPPDSTYTKSEFRDILVFALWLRPMFGIFGEYVKLAKVDYDKTNMEFMTVNIMSNTEMHILPVYVRLERYVKSIKTFATFANNKSVSITAGISSEDLPEWVINNAIMRRIIVAKVDYDDGDGRPTAVHHVVGNIHSFVDSVAKRPEAASKFDRVKARRKQYGEDGQERPVLDMYRPTQQETFGDIAYHTVYLSRRGNVVGNLDPDIDLALMDKMLSLKTLDIESFNVTICQLVLSLVMSPNSIMSLVTKRLGGLSKPGQESTENPVEDAVIITKMILWKWGHKELSLLMGAREASDELSADDGQDQITKDTMNILNELFVYQRKRQNARSANVAYTDIMELSRRIGRGKWECVYPSSMANEVKPYLNMLGLFTIPSNMPELIARLVIDVANRKKAIGPVKAPE